MTKQEYTDYQAAVAVFFARENITHLSTGAFECPACEVEFDADKCPKCGISREETCTEPFFSWRTCDCCGSHLGGDRVRAAGWNKDNAAAPLQKYTICTDCEYYNEYHNLDDATMFSIENSTE